MVPLWELLKSLLLLHVFKKSTSLPFKQDQTIATLLMTSYRIHMIVYRLSNGRVAVKSFYICLDHFAELIQL